MKNISILGTSSDSGKSTITLALVKILYDLGYKVTPFKAQNMSNNSNVCEDGSEIGIAQFNQAKVINLHTTYHLNPILLKPQKEATSQVVINGKAKFSMSAREYFKRIEEFKPIVKEAFEYLNNNFDIVVAEGAGSPVELNLMKRDLSNIFVAREFNTKIILVADIERGGVFASIYGTYKLLPKELQQNVIGVVINKFRGDKSLFDEGIKIIEDEFKIPVLGVLPYLPINIGFEDGLSLKNYTQHKRAIIKVALIKFPHISNYTDIDPLIIDNHIQVDFIESFKPLSSYDMVILSGTKTTIEDLKWLKQNGLFEEINDFRGLIFGICGGYEMMFETLKDIDGVESPKGAIESGFGFIDDEIEFLNDKVLKRGEYSIFNQKVRGYEIHCGVSKKYPLEYKRDNIYGTFLHGVFENDNFREKIFKSINSDYVGFNYQKQKEKIINGFVDKMRESLDIDRILKAITN